MPLNIHSKQPDRRSGHRLPAVLPGQFIVNGRGIPCQIVNLSRNGAKIALDTKLLGNVHCLAARLRIDGLRLFDVRIRWRSANGIGLGFEKGRLTKDELASLSSTG